MNPSEERGSVRIASQDSDVQSQAQSRRVEEHRTTTRFQSVETCASCQRAGLGMNCSLQNCREQKRPFRMGFRVRPKEVESLRLGGGLAARAVPRRGLQGFPCSHPASGLLHLPRQQSPPALLRSRPFTQRPPRSPWDREKLLSWHCADVAVRLGEPPVRAPQSTAPLLNRCTWRAGRELSTGVIVRQFHHFRSSEPRGEWTRGLIRNISVTVC